MRMQDPDEKIKARQALVTGALADKLKLLSKLVVRRCATLAACVDRCVFMTSDCAKQCQLALGQVVCPQQVWA